MSIRRCSASVSNTDRRLARVGVPLWALACAVILLSAQATADEPVTLIEYDASLGTLPQDQGWIYVPRYYPPNSVTVADGLLSLDSALWSGYFWGAQILGQDPYPGAFLEVTVRLDSEEHTAASRGLGLGGVGQAFGGSACEVGLNAWEDRIFVTDGTVSGSQPIAEYMMDTTDGFHTYRIETTGACFVVFVDGEAVMKGSVQIVPYYPVMGYQFSFGDGSWDSGSVSQWSTVRAGRLSLEQAAEVTLLQTIENIGLLQPSGFKNKQMQDTLVRKLDEALALVEVGNYSEAVEKLENDIVSKTDGCAKGGAPDKTDWVTSCEGQAKIYPLVQQSIEFLNAL